MTLMELSQWPQLKSSLVSCSSAKRLPDRCSSTRSFERFVLEEDNVVGDGMSIREVCLLMMFFAVTVLLLLLIDEDDWLSILEAEAFCLPK